MKQILPAVIVVIEESIAEFHKGNRRLGNSGLVTDISEGPFAIVPESMGKSSEKVVLTTERCPLFS